MSTQGPFSGQYFGDYYGDYLGATAGVTPGWMVGSAHISFSATGVLTAATPQPSLPIFGGFSNRPWRDAPFLPVRPRRPRKQRQQELVFLSH